MTFIVDDNLKVNAIIAASSNSIGTDGQVLASNGSVIYWADTAGDVPGANGQILFHYNEQLQANTTLYWHYANNTLEVSGNVVVSNVATFNSNKYLLLPRGTTGERDGSPVKGQFRYNTTDDVIEWYNGSGWQQAGTSAGEENQNAYSDLIGDSGTASADAKSDTITFTGANGITTTVSDVTDDDTVTIVAIGANGILVTTAGINVLTGNTQLVANATGLWLNAGAINISEFVNDSNFSSTVGTVTSVGITAGNLIDVSGGPVTGSGNITVDVDLSELITSTSDADGDFFAVVDASNVQKKLTKANINLSGFNNDANFSSTVGTVTEVTGGNGLTGSITTSGSLSVGAGDGITVNADDIAVNGANGILVTTDGVNVQTGNTQLVANTTGLWLNAGVINISEFVNDSNFSSTVGTVTSVTGGNGLTVTNGTTTPDLNVGQANGIIVDADSIQVKGANGILITTDGVNVKPGDSLLIANTTGLFIDNTFDNLTSKDSGTGNYTTTGNFTASQLISTVTTGTAPLVISSTTKVPNLNADLLDGFSSGSFLKSDEDDSFTGTITGTSDQTNPVITIDGGGPNIVRFLDAGVSTTGIDLVFRTSPNTLGFEKSTDGTKIWQTDVDDLSTTFQEKLIYTILSDGTTDLIPTVDELNYVDGVTSNIQTQLDDKAPLVSPALTGTATAVNLTISGDLTVNGTTSTINSDNINVANNLIELNSGLTGANPNDSGIIIERGSSGDNAFIGWDESADQFILGTTTATGDSIGDLSITAGTIQADITGKAADADALGSTVAANYLKNTDGANGIVIINNGINVQTGNTQLVSNTSGLWLNAGVVNISEFVNDANFVDYTGTPLDNQIAIFTDTNTIEGDANFTWTGTALGVTGQFNIDNVRIDGNVLSTTNADGDLTITPDGKGYVQFSGNSIILPTGITANRPQNAGDGQLSGALRFNTTDNIIEWYNGSGWIQPGEAGGQPNEFSFKTIEGDTGSAVADTTTDTLSITGGNGITTTASDGSPDNLNIVVDGANGILVTTAGINVLTGNTQLVANATGLWLNAGAVNISEFVNDANFVDYTGTPLDNQIAIFTDTNTIEGDANFIWLDQRLTITGNTSVSYLELTNGIVANGSLGTTDQVLTANSTGGTFWKVAPGSDQINIDGGRADSDFSVDPAIIIDGGTAV